MKIKELFWWVIIVGVAMCAMLWLIASSLNRMIYVMENPPEVVVNIEANSPP